MNKPLNKKSIIYGLVGILISIASIFCFVNPLLFIVGLCLIVIAGIYYAKDKGFVVQVKSPWGAIILLLVLLLLGIWFASGM